MAQSRIENSKSRVLIAGAGPAGASAAIRLAQSGFEVTLIEKEKFPRHKLCGEFISPECLAHFRALGVIEEMLSAGGARLAKTVFYAPNGKAVSVPSAWFGAGEEALSLSRAEMDFRLLERAKSIGVRVLEETSVSGLLIENGAVRGAKVRRASGVNKEIAADLTVDATGRARVLGKMAEREFSARDRAITRTSKKTGYEKQRSKPKDQNSKLVGFKTHIKNARLESGACEIYFFRGGYGGLSLVEGGTANHCFLIKSAIVREFNGDAEKIVREVVSKNRRAAETLSGATPLNDWLAVSVDGFGLKNLNPAPGILAIGDAGAFIDPFTGSGMLMALESGEILAAAVESSAAQQIAESYEKLHTQKFRKRLLTCSLLRRAAFAPGFAAAVVSALGASERALCFLARATRPGRASREN